MKSVMAKRNMVTKMPSTMPMASAADVERLGALCGVGVKVGHELGRGLDVYVVVRVVVVYGTNVAILFAPPNCRPLKKERQMERRLGCITTTGLCLNSLLK
jgi:hypothetical protein